MFSHKFPLLLLALMLCACDDLNPSSSDNRVVAEAGTSGHSVNQVAPDFALFDTLNMPVTLSVENSGVDAVVLYFTMWCPVCDSHMSHIRSQLINQYPSVKFYFIDYVSASVSLSRQAQLANGYVDLDVLVDDAQHVLGLYNATMGSVVVIDSAGIVKMNEDYKDGQALLGVLTELP